MFFLLALLVCAPEIIAILTGIGKAVSLPFALKSEFDAGAQCGKIRAQTSIQANKLPKKDAVRPTLEQWAREEMPAECSHPEVWQNGFLKGYSVEILMELSKLEKRKLAFGAILNTPVAKRVLSEIDRLRSDFKGDAELN